MPQSCTLVLPYPPSVNSAWKNVRGKGRVRTERYNAWLALATARTVPPPPRISGNIHLSMHATPPDKRRRDLTNIIKCTEDFLVKRGVIEDDSLVESLFIKWDRNGGKSGVRVEVVAA